MPMYSVEKEAQIVELNTGRTKLHEPRKNENRLLYLWKVKSDIIQCIHLCICMLAISFYFVNCVIISCEL